MPDRSQFGRAREVPGCTQAGKSVLRWRLAGVEMFLEQRRNTDSEMDGFSSEPRRVVVAGSGYKV